MPLYILLQQGNVSIYYVYICIARECIVPNDIRGLLCFSIYYTVSRGFPGLSMLTRGLAGLFKFIISVVAKVTRGLGMSLASQCYDYCSSLKLVYMLAC
jgi:hypothetical protein